VQLGRTRKIQSFSEDAIRNLKRSERPDGSGDLVFARQTRVDHDGDNYTVEIKFVGIPQVRSVENIINGAFKSRK